MDFFLSGAFAYTGKELGAIDATVQLLLLILTTSLFVPGLFLAICVVSLSIGTSLGRYFRQFGSQGIIPYGAQLLLVGGIAYLLL